jgi:ABC-type transport system involved in cytochrome bd biosynthesis fused ATPase/permease subunit
VRKCDVIYVIDDGRIIGRGTYDELMVSNAKFRKMARAQLEREADRHMPCVIFTPVRKGLGVKP